MGKIAIRLGAAIVLLLAAWVGWLAWRAHRKLVTLNVHHAEIRTVVPQIEWQTWERIIVQHDVAGRVTLNVHQMPLERVLAILSEQVSARWLAVYPLYSSRRSLAALRRLAAGEAGAATNGWSALAAPGLRPGRGIWGAGPPGAAPAPVSLAIIDEDIAVAAQGLARFGPVQVVPEDGTSGKVWLNLTAATVPEAVARLAAQVDRSWGRFYTIQPLFRGALVRREPDNGDDAAGTGPGPGQQRGPMAGPPAAEQLAARRQQFEQQFAAQLATMTPEQQQQARARRARWEEMRHLTPEQRREQFAALAASPEFQQRMQQRLLQRLRDSTPEQRAARDARMVARQAARAHS